MTHPLIRMRGVGRRFPGVVANHDVDLDVLPGTIHAIVGENGAGKTTLMRLLAGMLRPDAGEIRIDDEPVRFRSPADAIGRGIGMVQQHLSLADDLTVLENLVLGAEPTRLGRLDVAAAREAIRELGARHDLALDPDMRVEDLPIGARQKVEILKVLFRRARILILDEPTAALVPQESDALLRTMRSMRSEGVTILFVSHRLDEVLSTADAITVMRAGTTLGTSSPGALDVRRLAALVVGEDLPQAVRHSRPPGTTVMLSIRGLRSAAAPGGTGLAGVSLDVRAGEIVGIAGVEGNGQSELFDAILGLSEPDAGSVELAGHDVSRASVRARRGLGLAAIPADRHRDALLPDAPLWENRVLGHQHAPPLARGPWLDRTAARASTRALVREADVRTPGIDVAVSALSGGNQQRLIVARELADGPRVLLAAHPTRGVDVGAQAAIWSRLASARDMGLAVLLLSADLEELLRLCDRIAVMLRGSVVAELDPRALTPERLGAAMTGLAGAADA